MDTQIQINLDDDLTPLLQKKLAHHSEQIKVHKRKMAEIQDVINKLKQSENIAIAEDKEKNKKDNTVKEGNNKKSTSEADNLSYSAEDYQRLKLMTYECLLNEAEVGKGLSIPDLYTKLKEKYLDMVNAFGEKQCKQMISSILYQWGRSGKVDQIKGRAENFTRGSGKRNYYFISKKTTTA